MEERIVEFVAGELLSEASAHCRVGEPLSMRLYVAK
jgi:hypothetical protein